MDLYEYVEGLRPLQQFRFMTKIEYSQWTFSPIPDSESVCRYDGVSVHTNRLNYEPDKWYVESSHFNSPVERRTGFKTCYEAMSYADRTWPYSKESVLPFENNVIMMIEYSQWTFSPISKAICRNDGVYINIDMYTSKWYVESTCLNKPVERRTGFEERIQAMSYADKVWPYSQKYEHMFLSYAVS